MSQGMPAARIIGPEKPQAIASSLLTMRDVDVALLEDAVVGDEADRVLEQLAAGCRASRRCRRAASAARPGGRRRGGSNWRASARPTRARRSCSVSSRTSNSHRFGVIAPTSMMWLPRLSMWLEMRVSSANSTRMYCARSGTSRPEQLLDREHEAVLHAHRRAVIEPVEVGQRLERRSCTRSASRCRGGAGRYADRRARRSRRRAP